MSFYKLKELGSFKNGANFPKGSYGKGVPIVNVKDLFTRRYVDLSCLAELKEGAIKREEEYMVENDDILFSRSSLVQSGAGMCAIAHNIKTRILFCGFIIRFRVLRKEIVNPLFLLYLLRTPAYRKLFTGTQQTSIVNINQDSLGDITVDLPSIDIQNSIVSVLKSIDDDNDNNYSICYDLEAMAKLLYDYWFVQYDYPDENGKPYKSSGGKMVWNEQLKREIPEGWIVLPLSNYLNCNQNTITPNNLGEYIAYLDTGSLTENVIDQIQTINRSEGLPSRARRVVKENNILYSTVRPIQEHYGIIKHPAENMIASTGFAVLSAKQGSSYNELFYLFITSENNLRTLDAIANNSVSSYPSINPDDILNLKIALPPDITCLKGLCGKLQNCYEMIDAKHKENKELEQLRDFLLPMLMNGQVKA